MPITREDRSVWSGLIKKLFKTPATMANDDDDELQLVPQLKTLKAFKRFRQK